MGIDALATAGVAENDRATRAMKALGAVKAGIDSNLGGMAGLFGGVHVAQWAAGRRQSSRERLKLSRLFFW